MSDEKITDPTRLRRGAHRLTLSVEVEPDGSAGQVDGLALEVEALAFERGRGARDVLETLCTDAVVEAIAAARTRGQRRRLAALEQESARLRAQLGDEQSRPVVFDGPYKVIGVDEGSVDLAPVTEEDEPEPLDAEYVEDDEPDEADEPPPARAASRWDKAKGRA